MAQVNRTYTKEDLRLAFEDGVAVGIASQDGTFGEDFMGGPAAEKAKAFIKQEGSSLLGPGEYWERLWAYSGGAFVLDHLYEELNPGGAARGVRSGDGNEGYLTSTMLDDETEKK
jgi:hypothetical protein